MIQYKRSHHKNLKQIQERIGKPKDIWKATESLGLPNKSSGYIVGALAES